MKWALPDRILHRNMWGGVARVEIVCYICMVDFVTLKIGHYSAFPKCDCSFA